MNRVRRTVLMAIAMAVLAASVAAASTPSELAPPVNLTVKWAANITGISTPSIVVSGTGFTYVAAGDRVICLRPDGSEHWTYNVGAQVRAMAVDYADNLYVAADRGGFLSLSRDGRQNWFRRISVAAGMVVLSDGDIAVGTDTGVVLLGQDGRVRWTYIPSLDEYT